MFVMSHPSDDVRVTDVRFRLTCMYYHLKCQFNRILLPKVLFFHCVLTTDYRITFCDISMSILVVVG